MTDELPLRAGDTAVVVQLSPCVGGLVRTWADGSPPQLWSTPDATWLHQRQATGSIGRTLREEQRYREVALLSEGSGTLLVQGRFPATADDGEVRLEADVVRLEPAGPPTGHIMDDLRALLTRAVLHCVARDEFLVVERGGWDAPPEPFCLFVLMAEPEGPVSVIETAPDPVGSSIWGPHIVEGRPSQHLSAHAKPDTIDVAAIVMLDAIVRWGLAPWDLALTFGTR